MSNQINFLLLRLEYGKKQNITQATRKNVGENEVVPESFLLAH